MKRGSAAQREHHGHAPPALRWAVITVSDSRDEASDDSGRILAETLLQAGHAVLERLIIPDDREEIHGTLAMLLRDPELDGIITNGGTGIAPRDVTIEAATPLIGKDLPGFGELLRHLSFETLGPAAYLSRAHAATLPAPDAVKLLYMLPGSPDACLLAITDLIIPEAGHAFSQANRGRDLAGRWDGASEDDGDQDPEDDDAPRRGGTGRDGGDDDENDEDDEDDEDEGTDDGPADRKGPAPHRRDHRPGSGAGDRRTRGA